MGVLYASSSCGPVWANSDGRYATKRPSRPLLPALWCSQAALPPMGQPVTTAILSSKIGARPPCGWSWPAPEMLPVSGFQAAGKLWAVGPLRALVQKIASDMGPRGDCSETTDPLSRLSAHPQTHQLLQSDPQEALKQTPVPLVLADIGSSKNLTSAAALKL